MNINCLSCSTKRSWANSKDVSNRSINSNDDNQFINVRDNNFVEKCPTCFMIFPSTMTASDRSQHVHEHYKDD